MPFFFSAPCSVRALHSFPTRRSSDLAAGVESAAQDARILLSFVTGVELVRLPLLTELDDDHVRRFDQLVARRTERVPRSEEHTSELQSPCNLVCRLLLEKKKTNKTCR